MARWRKTRDRHHARPAGTLGTRRTGADPFMRSCTGCLRRGRPQLSNIAQPNVCFHAGLEPIPREPVAGRRLGARSVRPARCSPAAASLGAPCAPMASTRIRQHRPCARSAGAGCLLSRAEQELARSRGACLSECLAAAPVRAVPHLAPCWQAHFAACAPPSRSPGSYSKGGFGFQKSRCSLCDAGTVQPLGGQPKCNVCKDGEWQNREGQTACKACRQVPGILGFRGPAHKLPACSNIACSCVAACGCVPRNGRRHRPPWP